jgi:hypothetical protein
MHSYEWFVSEHER